MSVVKSLLSAAALILAASGCTAIGGERSGIVVTTNILGDIIENIVDGETEVTVLMGPNADPHSFAINAKQAAKLEQADLVIHNGLGLEEGVQHHVDAADHAGVPSFAVAESVDPIDYTAGDTAGKPDPHFWTDPIRVADAVDQITQQITDNVSGVDSETIEDNAQRYRFELKSLHEKNIRDFGDIPPAKRKLVTNHHVFGYLAKRYDFEIIGAVVPSGTTLASPSSSDLKDLADAVDKAGVPAVFADSSQPDKLADAMAREAGVDIDVIRLHSESLTTKDGGAATFLQMSRHNTEDIVNGLG